MTTQKNIYDDLLEITFWQQLNKQLTAYKNQGKPISEKYFNDFQQFCLENRLFHRITANSLTETMPLYLVIDFSSLRTLTYGLPKWREILEELLNKSVTLDLESARCDAFDEMKKLEASYDLNPNIKEEDDPELYEVINQFDELYEKFRIDYDHIFDQLFQLKSSSILKIKELSDISINIDYYKSDAISIDLQAQKNRDHIWREYIESFCRPALALIEPFPIVKPFTIDRDIYSHYDEMKKAYPSNKSVQDFIDYEESAYRRFSDMIRRYRENLLLKLKLEKSDKINLLDKNVFSHFNLPFPVI